MGMYGSGWWSYMRASDEKPKVTWQLMKRVLGYSAPYRWQIVGMLAMISLDTGLTLLTPLIFRDLIDHTIPSGNIQRLIGLAFLLLFIPALGGIVNVFQRRLNVNVGEGVIYDLRVALYSHLQRMSLRFFTNTKIGELMSRLNNDVVGAQNAISNTIVSIVTDIIQAGAVLAVMLTLEWHLTLISVAILPLFILAAQRLGYRLRDIARKQLEANAQMNAMMNETLNIGGALLVKLFGRRNTEIARFDERAAACAGYGDRPGSAGLYIFCDHRPAERHWHGSDLWHRWISRHPSHVHHRYNRSLWRLSDQPVQLFAGVGQCAGRFCYLGGELRACLRSDRSARGYPRTT